MQSCVTSTRDGVYDETQTFRRRRGSLFYDGRTRNGSAFDYQIPAITPGRLFARTGIREIPIASATITRRGLLGELMAAGTAAEIGIAGTAGAAISSLWRGAAACNEYK